MICAQIFGKQEDSSLLSSSIRLVDSSFGELIDSIFETLALPEVVNVLVFLRTFEGSHSNQYIFMAKSRIHDLVKCQVLNIFSSTELDYS